MQNLRHRTTKKTFELLLNYETFNENLYILMLMNLKEKLIQSACNLFYLLCNTFC